MRAALQLLPPTLRDWSWSHSRWALFVGAATLFANGTPFGNSGSGADALSGLAYNILQFGFPLVLLLSWAHRVVDAKLLPPLAAYSLVLLEVPLGVWVIAPPLGPLLGTADWWTSYNDFVLASTTLFWHALGVGVVAQRRQSLKAQARRLQAEQNHAQRQRELAATELLALQARVDPPLLFERLKTIDTELQQDPSLAPRRLAALIELLRALQPHAQAKVSSLERELEAVRAYACLTSRDAQGAERLLIQVPDALLPLPMAPLVLLPLLRPLLAAPGLIWQLSAEASQPPRLRIAALGPDRAQTLAAAQQVELGLLRQRLQAVLGPEAELSLNDEQLPRFELRWNLSPA